MFVRAISRLGLRKQTLLAVVTVGAISVLHNDVPKPFYRFRIMERLPLASCEGESQPTTSGPVEIEDTTKDTESESEDSELDEEEATEPPIVIEEDAEADAAWEADKEKCSFCRHFMLSPCKQQFKYWSKCVDLAKSTDRDFVQGCKQYTRALMDCTDANGDYFSAPPADEQDATNPADQPAGETIEQ